jgi:hypothetical protein
MMIVITGQLMTDIRPAQGGAVNSPRMLRNPATIVIIPVPPALVIAQGLFLPHEKTALVLLTVPAEGVLITKLTVPKRSPLH